MGEHAKCKSCGAPVVFARTSTGSLMPFDRDPVLESGWTLAMRGGRLVCERADDRLHPQPTWRRYEPHWATCPNAKSHRKRGSK